MFSARASAALIVLAATGTAGLDAIVVPAHGGSTQAHELSRYADPFGSQWADELRRLERATANYDRIVTAHDFGPDEFAWTRIGDGRQRYRNAARVRYGSNKPEQQASGYG